ncbi:type VI secretion system Vgr family protein [Variovorax sp. DXTD-1]|uniref:type VI secretion system Vgr family protein n=1 Tax=Variovorax sp. DXTD-1 TaxID=2495592 RepID=UPI000F89CD3E|nr:type VI secretion system tip protein TssI/VgrG [Variovorax sp. DXTD-1]RST52522.1 type VI secretion system tip protein VgrG [Variovorax sp. DXTD-1]
MAIRIVKAHTPLAEDQLMFRSMHGTEGLSQLFEFEVDLVSPSVSLDMKSVLGKPLSLEILTAGEPRFLNGQIVRFTMVGKEAGTSRYVLYRATVRPWLWYLTRTSDCKIFQNKSVVDILEEVFADYNFAFEKKLSGSYRQWEYCVQYQETDFAFVSRLMEHEGIYYYFKHDKNQHTLVLADDIGAHETLPGYPKISYLAADRDPDPFQEVIDQWQVTEEIRPGTYVVDDYDFKKSKADLMGMRSQPRGNPHDTYEIYEWMGGFSEAEQGEHYSCIRLEEAQSQAERDVGHCSVRGMAPGYRFTMQNCPRQDDNREYLIVSVAYALREGGYESGAADSHYSFSFAVQPTSYPFRPPRVTPMTRTNGPQTATVVGKVGQEYWVDQYGRVKVQFRWDRYGKSDENSSCWVRVSSAWAGSNYGAVNHPRKGQEVIVDFIGGHPDRPIIIGRVYNSDQMPPLELPAKVTVSGFVSRSQDGTPANANEFILDDAPGSELVRIHAEKDFELDVEADERDTIAGDRTTTVTGNDTLTVGKARTTTVKAGLDHAMYQTGSKLEVSGGLTEHFFNDRIEITTKGGAEETVETGMSEVNVLAGLRRETFDKGLHADVKEGMKEHVKTGDSELRVEAGKRTEFYKTGWTRNIDSGGGSDTIKDGLTETIETGDHVSTVSAGDYSGKAEKVTIEATAGDVEIKASGDFLFEGNHVKRVNRVLLWDWSPTSITATGISSASFGVNNSNSVVANFNVLTSIATNGVKFEKFGVASAVGTYTQTVTAFHTPNPGYELSGGYFVLFAKAFFGIV